VVAGVADVTVRRAVPDDAAELTRLRAVLLKSLGIDHPPQAWWAATERLFAERLARDDRFAAYVIDDAERPGRLTASAVGWVEVHLPSVRTLSPLNGRIASVCVDAPTRGHGHGRAVMEAIMGFLADRGVTYVELQSTDMAEGFYRSLGFIDSWGIALSWRPSVPAPAPSVNTSPAGGRR
jgi:ribosomal protein S18 acetylase RimI-like enzyme